MRHFWARIRILRQILRIIDVLRRTEREAVFEIFFVEDDKVSILQSISGLPSSSFIYQETWVMSLGVIWGVKSIFAYFFTIKVHTMPKTAKNYVFFDFFQLPEKLCHNSELGLWFYVKIYSRKIFHRKKSEWPFWRILALKIVDSNKRRKCQNTSVFDEVGKPAEFVKTDHFKTLSRVKLLEEFNKQVCGSWK